MFYSNCLVHNLKKKKKAVVHVVCVFITYQPVALAIVHPLC